MTERNKTIIAILFALNTTALFSLLWQIRNEMRMLNLRAQLTREDALQAREHQLL